MQPEHIEQILKAVVTPTGIHLYGPEPEIKNRVLRKYSSHIDYFLQVSFLDENWERIWYDRVTSNEEIYHARFKGVMQGVINIAGRGYEVGIIFFLFGQANPFSAPSPLQGLSADLTQPFFSGRGIFDKGFNFLMASQLDGYLSMDFAILPQFPNFGICLLFTEKLKESVLGPCRGEWLLSK